jgi:glycosyltransferase involved in cell wall biosynthesis
MKFIFASYIKTPGFDKPKDWLTRIQAYLGVLEALASRHSVTSIEQINYHGDHLQNGVQYHFMDFGKQKLFFPWKLHRFIKNKKPDIILIHGMDFPLQVIQLRLYMGKGTRIIVQSHGNKMPSAYKRILQRIADKCINAYFFVSAAMAEPWLKEALISDPKKVHEIMVGSSIFQVMDRGEAQRKTGVNGSPVFLWAGNLDANKDPVTLVKAFLRFSRLNPNAKLYMVHQSDQLLEKVIDLLCNDMDKQAVVLVGKVPHEDMLYWFNSADFFVSASHFEVFGAAVVEAMSCGCVPILTNIPSFQKITGNGSCGLLYEAGNEDAALAALQQAVEIDLPAERKKVLRQFEQHLSFDAIAQKIQEVAASL